ncbi:MAG: hypothetical protein ACR2JW_18575 [Thermomicrobiales bacterium]
MRRFGLVLCFALFAALTYTSVAAADPTISVAATRRDTSGGVVSLLPVADKQGNVLPPLLLLGEYVIASGQGFPANQPVMAFLVAQNQAYPLAFQDLAAPNTAQQAAPTTDATGGFQNYAFTLPLAAQLTGTSGEIQISAGSVTARAPVGLDSGLATKAGRGDKIAVSIGAGFSVIAVILILLLLRGLPIYPVGTVAARRAREPETT